MPVGQARVYRPDSRFDAGWLTSIGALYREIISYRSHIATLFAKDFESAYRGTVLGVFWNFTLPLLPVSTYILLATLRVFPPREGIPAAIYISFGATIWFLMIGLIRQPIRIVKSRNNEIMKTALPMSASIAASFAMLVFETIVRAALVIVLTLAMKNWPTAAAAFIPPIVIIASVFGLALGIMLSILNVVFPDVERVVNVVLQYGIFLSGVIFPVSYLGPLEFLEVYNPFNVFINAARDLTFIGHLSHPEALAIWSAVGVVLFIISARFFYVMEHRIRGLA